MNKNIITFYTDPSVRATRFLLYGYFALIAFAYIVVNRLLLSRPEHIVSLEVVALLVVMTVSAPLIYDMILVYRERRNVDARLSSITKVLAHQHAIILREEHFQLAERARTQTLEELEKLYLAKEVTSPEFEKSYIQLISKLEESRRFGMGLRRLASAVVLLLCGFGALFSALSYVGGVDRTAIYVAFGSILFFLLSSMLLSFEYRETLMKTLIEILMLRAAFPHDILQGDEKSKQPKL